MIEVLFPTRVCQRLENQETFVKNIFVCSVNSNKLLNYMQALVIENQPRSQALSSDALTSLESVRGKSLGTTLASHVYASPVFLILSFSYIVTVFFLTFSHI